MKHLFYHCFTTFLISSAFLFSCKKDQMFIIDPAVQEHYNNFLSEASHRNIKLNLKAVNSIVLQGKSSIKSDNGFPSAGYYDHGDKAIYLDTTSESYQKNIEVLIFHELGHAMLGREHDDEFLIDPDYTSAVIPKSIMNGKFNPYYKYELFKREYYINELFNPSEPEPYWLK